MLTTAKPSHLLVCKLIVILKLMQQLKTISDWVCFWLWIVFFVFSRLLWLSVFGALGFLSYLMFWVPLFSKRHLEPGAEKELLLWKSPKAICVFVSSNKMHGDVARHNRVTAKFIVLFCFFTAGTIKGSRFIILVLDGAFSSSAASLLSDLTWWQQTHHDSEVSKVQVHLSTWTERSTAETQKAQAEKEAQSVYSLGRWSTSTSISARQKKGWKDCSRIRSVGAH